MTEQLDRWRELLGESVDLILSLQELHDVDEPMVIYASGSLVEGFGHATSDIDIFVVTDRHAQGGLSFEIENYEVAVDFGRNRRIDYEYWSFAAVDALAGKLDALSLGRGFLAVLTSAEEVFIHRLRVGIPLVERGGLEELQRRFDFSRLQRYLTIKAVREVDDVLDDLTGMLASGDLDSALLRSVDLVGYVVDTWTHHCGNTNPYQKWRPRILESLPPSDRTRQVLDAFWGLRFPDAGALRADPSRCRAHVVRCMELANTVTDWVQP